MYKTLVLSSGGFKGFGMLGVLDNIYKKHRPSFNNFIGSSVGGVICFFLALGYEPIQILWFLINLMPLNLKEKTEIMNNIKELLKKEELSSDCTFLDFFLKTKKNLTLTSYDIKEDKEYFYNFETFPEKTIISALEETMAIPFVIDTKDFFKVDGCLCSPFPIRYTLDQGYDKILGIYILTPIKCLLPVRNPYDDIKTIIYHLLNKITKYEVDLAKSMKLEIYHFSFNILFEQFQIEIEQMLQLFEQGQMQIIK